MMSIVDLLNRKYTNMKSFVSTISIYGVALFSRSHLTFRGAMETPAPYQTHRNPFVTATYLNRPQGTCTLLTVSVEASFPTLVLP